MHQFVKSQHVFGECTGSEGRLVLMLSTDACGGAKRLNVSAAEPVCLCTRPSLWAVITLVPLSVLCVAAFIIIRLDLFVVLYS